MSSYLIPIGQVFLKANEKVRIDLKCPVNNVVLVDDDNHTKAIIFNDDFLSFQPEPNDKQEMRTKEGNLLLIGKVAIAAPSERSWNVIIDSTFHTTSPDELIKTSKPPIKL